MGHKGQFKKGGGRIGDGRKKARKSTAVARRRPGKTKTVTKYRTRSAPKRHHRRRRHGGGGMPNPLHLALAAGGLAYLTGSSGPEMVRTYGAKIPGATTFGIPAVVGIGCLAVDRFVKSNKYLKLAGIAGIVLAATKIGEQGTNFKFIGDVGDDEYTGDVGDDDVGDADDVGDYDD